MSKEPRADEHSSDNYTSRRELLRGMGMGAVGTVLIGGGSFVGGIYVAGSIYNGGNAYNTTSNPETGGQEDSFGNGDSINDTDNPNDSNETEDNQSNESLDEEESNEDLEEDGDDFQDQSSGIQSLDEDPVYSIDGEVEVNLNDLISTYEESDIEMGVQDNGSLIAWNTSVQTDEGYNPLWRFESSGFPNREFYEISGEHPVETIFDELESDIETFPESMAEIFYDEDSDEGSIEDHREYKEIDYEDLKNGLVTYSSVGSAQDYFFNRSRSLDEGEPVLEDEWQELLQDSL